MTGRQCFVWGCLGAIAPEVLRFFKIASNGTALPQLNWTFYAMLLIAYIVIAGFVTVAFKQDSEWKGLWVGASLPALIATLVQVAPIPK